MVTLQAVNNVPIGSYWNKKFAHGAEPIQADQGSTRHVYMYFPAHQLPALPRSQ